MSSMNDLRVLIGVSIEHQNWIKRYQTLLYVVAWIDYCKATNSKIV